MKLLAAIALLLMPSAVVAQAGGTDPGSAIVTRAAKVYQSLTSFQAEYRHHLEDPVIGQSDSRGFLYTSGQNRFAMRSSDPQGEVVVIDGTYTWVYTPKDSPGQVMRYPPPANPVYGYNIIGWFMDKPLERNRVSFLRTEALDGFNTDVVLLEPVTKELPYRRATVWFDRESGLARRIDTEEPQGLKRSLVLTRLRQNASIPPSIFQFKVPAGVKVIPQ